MFGSFVYGMVKGKYNFKVRRESIVFPHLPSSMDGLKIVQISDAHLGTFGPHEVHELEPAIELIMNEQPDVIFFTGDLVNNLAEEAEPYIELFSRLSAPMGKFSILGNHDYARYVYHDDTELSVQMRAKNMEHFERIHQEMGFDLLRNASRTLEKNGETISLIGIENWGRNFFQYGDLNKAMTEVDPQSFQILLSHDPTHFEEQVMGKNNIALTLSGHTHGAQFGVEVPEWGVKWSPSSWFGYKRWGGLYQEGSQYLYVNRGLGCLGFPGRVGIHPEITVIELKSNA
jgi:predicted MPP superfamily phosphohydrolase